MPPMPWTNTAIFKAKPTEKPQRVFDGGGMYLEFLGRAETLASKVPLSKQRKRLAIGIYPDVSLARAREKHDEARRLLADGFDPGKHKKPQRT